jgi:cell division protein FtsQ
VAQNKKYILDKGKLIWVITIALVGILTVTALTRKKKGLVKDLVVEVQHLSDGENDFIKERDIKEIIRRSFDYDIEKEVRVGQVEVQRVEQVLEQDPFIENAESFIDANNFLHVKIMQREPICRIIDNNGLNYYLDKKGTKMPMSRYFSARVPIVTGAVPPHVPNFLERKKYLLKDVYDLVNHLEKDAFFKPFIQQIYVDAGGDFTLIPILGDQKIRIGNLSNLEEKLERVKVFYKEAMPYEGWKKYASISVKYDGQIICKKR